MNINPQWEYIKELEKQYKYNNFLKFKDFDLLSIYKHKLFDKVPKERFIFPADNRFVYNYMEFDENRGEYYLVMTNFGFEVNVYSMDEIENTGEKVKEI